MKLITPGTYTCDVCGKEYIAREQIFPDRDIRHDIYCPHCGTPLGYAEGTHDIITIKPHESEQEVQSCPLCESGILVTRINHSTNQTFWGCSNFPDCYYTKCKN